MKKIIYDTYDFERLITQGGVYVDKTALLHRLVVVEASSSPVRGASASR